MKIYTIPWTLASASPRRLTLLRQVGIEPDVKPSDVEEKNGGDNPVKQAEWNARQKLLAVQSQVSSGILLAADTIVVIQNTILGKPISRTNAIEILQSLSGNWHEVITAYSLTCIETGKCSTDHTITRVHMRKLTNVEINAYVDSGEPDDKAGAYGIQGKAGAFVDRIEGCYFNVVGLPLSDVLQAANQLL